MDHEVYLVEFLKEVDEDGKLRHREGKRIEFKQKFHKNMFPKYSRSMAAFANADGGYIIFGVSNRPRRPIGLNGRALNNFQDLDDAELVTYLNEHFSPEFRWEMGTIECMGKVFGYIFIERAENRPIICKRGTNDGTLREGAIYFRYRAQTREIRFEELQGIIQEKILEEQKRWFRIMEKIAKVGPENIGILDIRGHGLSFLGGWNNRWNMSPGPTIVYGTEPVIVTGMDITLFWEPISRMRYRNFLWRTEFYWVKKDPLLFFKVLGIKLYSYFKARRLFKKLK